MNPTYRNVVTGHGHKSAVVKSALQKFTRRGKWEGALYCLMELDGFKVYEVMNNLTKDAQIIMRNIIIDRTCDETKRAISIRSNMINRLVCIVFEDIGIANIQCIHDICDLYKRWIEDRTSTEMTIMLMEMLYKMCKSAKIRLCSDLKTVFNLPPYYGDHNELYEKVFSKNENYSYIYQDVTTFEDTLIRCCTTTSRQRKFDVFHAMSKELIAGVKLTKLWKLFMKIVKKNGSEQTKELCEKCYYIYKKLKHKERPIYFYTAILILLFQDEILSKIITIPDTDFRQIITNHWQRPKMQFEDYVLDLHTGNTSKSIVDFALEGSIVVNQCTKHYYPIMRFMYIYFKYLMSNKSVDRTELMLKYVEEIQVNTMNKSTLRLLLENAPYAQKRTGHRKRAVLVTNEYVYKGPYEGGIKNPVLVRNLYRNFILKYFNLDTYHPFISIEHGYLKSKSIGTFDSKIVKNVSTKVDKNINTIERKSFVYRVSELEKPDTLPLHMKITCMQHLYVAYVFGIGDTGTYNILLSKNRTEIAGIDLEENLKNSKFETAKNIFDLLWSRKCGGSKHQRKIYDEAVKHISPLKKVDIENCYGTLKTMYKTRCMIDVGHCITRLAFINKFL